MKIKMYYPKDEDANPYYSNNQKLNQCSKMVRELLKNELFIVKKWDGGHRSLIDNDCEVKLILSKQAKASMDNITGILDGLSDTYQCQWCIEE